MDRFCVIVFILNVAWCLKYNNISSKIHFLDTKTETVQKSNSENKCQNK